MPDVRVCDSHRASPAFLHKITHKSPIIQMHLHISPKFPNFAMQIRLIANGGEASRMEVRPYALLSSLAKPLPTITLPSAR